jgi:hypothetical protein
LKIEVFRIAQKSAVKSPFTTFRPAVISQQEFIGKRKFLETSRFQICHWRMLRI